MKKKIILITVVCLVVGVLGYLECINYRQPSESEKITPKALVETPKSTLGVISLFSPSNAYAAYTKDTRTAASDVSALTENSFCTQVNLMGFFNLSITGTWVGTVTVQRSFDGGTNWVDVENYTSNVQDVGYEAEENIFYRVGIKTGNYTSGTAVCRIGQLRGGRF